ncbi:MAG: hypothetical protein JW806_07545 [Sedimentisphaerales bacterium]|nr:hypothetical protein [Sedimentisphaerales bacterium]
MSIPLPLFIALPLASAFLLPLCGKKFKGFASLAATVVIAVLLVMSILSFGRFDVYIVGRWTIPLGINLVLDGLSALMLATISTVSFTAMLFSNRYMEQYTSKNKYLSLFLLMVTGMNGVVLSGDIFNLFVFLEIASIASYALVGFGCEHEELEAAFKYMTLGTVASMFVLFGVGVVYGNTGSLNMAVISRYVAENGINTGLAFALALFTTGFGLKAALVPFHAWLPDAHPSAPAPISAMLSGVLIKALGIYSLSRVIFNVLGISVQISWVLIALGVLSMVIGVFLAVGQWDFKRLLAYHSISQMGYVILGIGMAALILSNGGNPAWASLALLGGLFHLMNHAVFKSLLFLTSGSVEMSTGTRQLKELGGLAERLPVTRSTCTIASAAIAGVPPFNGFWSKLILVIAAVQAGLYGLAAVTVLVSIVTLISFLKVQRYVFLGELPENLKSTAEHRGLMACAMILLAILCVFMGALVIYEPFRVVVLDNAVNALSDGFAYAGKVLSAQILTGQ